jgi:hypothetical protein
MNKLAILVSVAAALSLGTATYAGNSDSSTVNIDSSGYAYGAINATLESADAVQYIGCQIGSDTTTSAYVSCFASDVTGRQEYCYDSNPSAATLSNLSAVSGSSVVGFQPDSTGRCSFIAVYNVSIYF